MIGFLGVFLAAAAAAPDDAFDFRRTDPAAVEAREEPLSLNTYPFSDPDPVPPTDERRYPYFRYDGSTAEGRTQLWDSVVLENDRIRVTLVPAIGGKVYGATDKATGRDFIYFNRAAKFRNIAMRGPWASGGIEFNFGIIGHAPSTATPVDWCVRTNGDGSVSYFCSNTEWINRTTWQVEVNLKAGDDFFTTRTLWHNGSGLPGPYYQWMNAAFSTRGDPELVFPGTFQVGHEGDAHPWPRNEDGREVSFVNRNDFGGNKSYHVIGGDPRFFGVWWKDWNLGAYHFNDFGEKYGRKAWIWALSREGGIWEDLLTDSDGQYMELQSGRAFNQPRKATYRTPFKHPTFAAGTTDAFEERWGVVRDRARLDAFGVGTNVAMRARTAPADFNWESAYGLYVRGQQALRERDETTAGEFLGKALAADGCLVPALVTLAELRFRQVRCDEALALAEKALSVDAYEPGANYLSGLIARERGDLLQALERLGLAAYSPSCRAAARAEMAKVYFRMGNDELALKSAIACGEADGLGLDGIRLKLTALRRLGRVDEARETARKALKTWPLAHAVRYEAWKCGVLRESDFRRAIRNEMPQQTYLELGAGYESCGCREEARELFRMSGCFLGRLRLAFMEDDARMLEALAGESVSFVFPFRRETLTALDWAVARSRCWKFRYLRALFLSANGRQDAARRELAAIDDADDAVFYLYRNGSYADLEKAAALEDSWRIGRAKMNRLIAAGEYGKAKSVGENYLGRYPKSNPIQILYARTLIALKDYKGCMRFLEGVNVLPSEFGDNATDVWQEAQRALGLPVTWPERLGKGEPYE